MLTRRGARSSWQMLDISAVLAIVAAGVVGIANVQPGVRRWIALAAMALFAALYYLVTWAGMEGKRGLGHAGLAVQTLLVLGLCALDPSSESAATYFSILFFVMSAMVMLFLPQRLALAWICVFTAVSAGNMIVARGLADGLRASLANVAGYFFFGAFAQSLRTARIAQETSAGLLEQLQAAHRQLQDYAAQVERLAVLEERNRLAREMHDTIGHQLTVAAVQLEGAQRLIPREPERAATMVGTVREQVREALAGLRRTVATLREPVESLLPLPQALQQLALGFQEATRLDVHLALPGDIRELPPAHRLALYRAAQEGLTNIQRHAAASDAWLELNCAGDAVRLTVADNGAGLPPDPGQRGFGLRGLQERAAQLGGLLVVQPRTGGGTELVLTLPLPALTERRDA